VINLHGSVSSYPASMLNFIWFVNEKCSSCQHLATWRHKIRCLPPSRKWSVLVHCLAERCKS